MNNVVAISDLQIGYENQPLVSHINATINSGELVCIIGRNGEGKSTLIKTLCKLIKPQFGKATINNHDLFGMSDKDFAQLISVVLTSKIAINQTSVKEFVAYGRYPFTNWIGTLTEHDQQLINNAIDFCGIGHLAHRDFSSLSDGEKQKVNIARTIAQNTPIIILDEPTAHLDLVNNIEVFKLLKTLTTDYHKIIVLSTHHIELAIQLADKIWMFNKGFFMEEKPKSILEKGLINTLFENDGVQYNSLTNTFIFDK